jgi:hypothetical protein
LPFAPGNRASIGHNGPDWERLAGERERVEQMLDRLFDLAVNAPSEATQVAAAVAFLNRVEGLPKTMAEVAAKESPPAKPAGIEVRFADSNPALDQDGGQPTRDVSFIVRQRGPRP